MAPTDRTTVVLRSLTDFTGATYLGANLDIHAYGVRSTQWSDFTTPRTDRPVRFLPPMSDAQTGGMGTFPASVVRHAERIVTRIA